MRKLVLFPYKCTQSIALLALLWYGLGWATALQAQTVGIPSPQEKALANQLLKNLRYRIKRIPVAGNDGQTREKLVLETDNIAPLANVLTNPGDGIAVEVVRYPSYQCGSTAYESEPSRRNGTAALNGELLKPVMRAEMVEIIRQQYLELQTRGFEQRNYQLLDGSLRNFYQQAKVSYKPDYFPTAQATATQGDVEKIYMYYRNRYQEAFQRLIDIGEDNVRVKGLVKKFYPQTVQNLKKFESDWSEAKNMQRSLRKSKTPGALPDFAQVEGIWQIPLGEATSTNSDFVEYNLAIIVNNKLGASEVQIEACPAELPAQAALPQPLYEPAPANVYLPAPPSQLMVDTVRFPVGETMTDIGALQNLFKVLTDTSIVLVSAKIEGYASVEGSFMINKQIQDARANTVRQIIQNVLSYPVPVNIFTDEAWDLFNKQLVNTPFASWTSKPRVVVKKLLEDRKTRRELEPQLNAQRMAILSLSYYRKPGADVELQVIQQEVQGLLRQLEGESKAGKTGLDATENYQRLAGLQDRLYLAVLNGSIPRSALSNLIYPNGPNFYRLRYNQLLLEQKLNPGLVTDKGWQDSFTMLAGQLAHQGAGDAKVKYNKALLLLAQWNDQAGAKRPADSVIYANVRKEYTSLRAGMPDSLNPAALDWAFRLKQLRYHLANNDWEKIKTGLPALASAAASQKDRTAALWLAQVHLRLHQQNGLDDEYLRMARQTLEAEATRPDASEDVLALHLLTTAALEGQTPAVVKLISDYKARMSNAGWCSMFVGRCHLPFQLFDSAELRSLYCQNCVDGNGAGPRTPAPQPR